jgi:hypothetical protein
MRPHALALLMLLALPACATAPADGSSKIQTTSQANRENLQSAMESPLRDVNLLRTKIPAVLLDAMADPYARPRPLNCATISAQLAPLNGALGADLDEPATDEDDLMERGRETALGVMAGAASSVIPFRGWVRRLTGAERHDKLVTAAVTAGAVRRGYLKGLGESKGCFPPLSQNRVSTGQPLERPARHDGKPRYQIR